jgi:chromosome segregation ATPase
VTFLNNYTEILFDNFSAVIKQNIQFQTQLKMAEQQLAILDDAKRHVDKLSVENRTLNERVNELTSLTSSYKNVSEDKGRLQVSLNETSQVNNQLQSQINDAQQELTRLRAQSSELQNLRKENKLLKDKLGIEEEKEEKPVKKITTKPATAGTF